jgi:hypothetical protein
MENLKAVSVNLYVSDHIRATMLENTLMTSEFVFKSKFASHIFRTH